MRPVLGYCCIWLSMLFYLPSGYAQTQAKDASVDIRHYEALIEPDIGEQKIKGEVSILFKVSKANPSQLVLDCGDLIIDRVHLQKQALKFEQKAHRVYIALPDEGVKGHRKVKIFYHGKPRRGIQFFPDSKQVYTVFSTSQWMPCQSKISDRASFDLHLVLPKGLTAIANGKLKSQKTLSNQKVQLHFRMRKEVPAYCLGFAIGPMNKCIDRQYGVKFQYLSADYSEKELWEIFEASPDMLRFFEHKAGVKYPGKCYSQVLPKGNISQEMHQFAVLRNAYGQQVLDTAPAINLGAHELAHQWWGNQVTCLDWTHFWLNEGMAVFMSSAYREYRFGRKAYLDDIALYQNAYQEVVDKGLDKPLQFPNWDQPTPEDRTLVYYKGAYFLHLLREELGDRIFWKGIRRYTRKYFGKSVVSKDLQVIMEKVSRKDLSRLFANWVYLY